MVVYPIVAQSCAEFMGYFQPTDVGGTFARGIRAWRHGEVWEVWEVRDVWNGGDSVERLDPLAPLLSALPPPSQLLVWRSNGNHTLADLPLAALPRFSVPPNRSGWCGGSRAIPHLVTRWTVSWATSLSASSSTSLALPTPTWPRTSGTRWWVVWGKQDILVVSGAGAVSAGGQLCREYSWESFCGAECAGY